jgi:hypothetical protein
MWSNEVLADVLLNETYVYLRILNGLCIKHFVNAACGSLNATQIN